MSTPILAAAKRGFREIYGVVVSAGLMDRTVKVRVGGRVWNDQVKKYFNRPKTHLVHDPNNSLVTGDVVAIIPGWPTSQHKRHVLKHIIAASGTPVEERPTVPTLEERIAAVEAKRAAKLERRAARQAAEIEARKAENEERAERQRRRLEKAGRVAPAPAPPRTPAVEEIVNA